MPSSGPGGREQQQGKQTASNDGRSSSADRGSSPGRKQPQTADAGSERVPGQAEGGEPTEDVALEEPETPVGGDAGAEGADAEPSLEELLEVLESASTGSDGTDEPVLDPDTGKDGADEGLDEAIGAMEAAAEGRAGSEGGESDRSGESKSGDLDSVLNRAEGGSGAVDAELAALDQALDESLEQFDGEILSGRRRAQAQAEQREAGEDRMDIEVTDASADEPTGPGNGGLPGDMSSGTGNSPGGKTSARKGDYEHASTTKAAIPPDIPDGSDDDVVARQIREAAMKEQDPELRKKLWEEYRKYKASQ